MPNARMPNRCGVMVCMTKNSACVFKHAYDASPYLDAEDVHQREESLHTLTSYHDSVTVVGFHY